MTDTWKTWTPEYDGHAPDDWDGVGVQLMDFRDRWSSVLSYQCSWAKGGPYRYRAYPSAKTLTAQCLALPQADREALIEALQKPQRDWADDVTLKVLDASSVTYRNYDHDHEDIAAVIRSMCRPKEESEQ